MMVARHKMPGKGLDMIRPIGNRCDLWRHALVTIRDNNPRSPTDHTVPYGTGFCMAHSRHFMPGYHHLVPPGQRLVSLG
jgi:hypothetical protein